MNKSINIVFMGTPDFAVGTLKVLYKNNFSIVAVVCPPDKPAGRGQKLKSCAVKQFAIKNNINLLQPEKLKSTSFINDLKELKVDLIVVVAFRMLPKEVWSIPKKGTFNIHASLLPEYRGAAPIHWAVINGETETGVTSFMIDENIDTGAILMSKKCTIDKNETTGQLHDKLMVMGGNLALDTCNAIINGNCIPKPQINSKTLKTAPKIFKENCRIDWTKSTKCIYNLIRGLSPFPIAWTVFISNSEEIDLIVKIHKASFEICKHEKNIAEIEMNKYKLRIYTKDGYITINYIQVPGKKKMDITSFLNGLKHRFFKYAFSLISFIFFQNIYLI